MAHSKDDPDQHGSSSNVETRRDLSSKDHAPSKVIIRRLPPTLTPENFLEHVSPLPDYDFFYFVRADMSLGQNAFTRAYISFLSPEDIFTFRDRFDGYVFIDAKGGEYPAIVEFAPFQKVPKKKTKKLDTKIGLIEQAFYTSEKITGSLNPTWQSFDLQRCDTKYYLTAKSVVVRVWCGHGDTFKVKIEAEVHFPGLLFFSNKLQVPGIKHQTDTLLFGLFNNIFIYYSKDSGNLQLEQWIPDTEAAKRDTIGGFRVDQFVQRPSYSTSNLKRIHIVQRAITQTLASVNRTHSDIEDKLLSSNGHSDKLSMREVLLMKVRQLRQELLWQTQQNQGEQEKYEKYQSEQNLRLNTLKDKGVQMQKLAQETEEKRTLHIQSREMLVKENAQVLFRRKQIIREMVHDIYPITEDEKSQSSYICNVRLPNAEDYQGQDELKVAVALGFTCHLTQMISLFMDLPLRYPMVHNGSRSTIIDHILSKLTDKEREFPLYGKGKEKLQYNYAVFLLNKNISQMRFYCGLGTNDLRLTLPNLKSLLEQRLGVRSSSALGLRGDSSTVQSPHTASVAGSQLSRISHPVSSNASSINRRDLIPELENHMQPIVRSTSATGDNIRLANPPENTSRLGHSMSFPQTANTPVKPFLYSHGSVDYSLQVNLTPQPINIITSEDVYNKQIHSGHSDASPSSKTKDTQEHQSAIQEEDETEEIFKASDDSFFQVKTQPDIIAFNKMFQDIQNSNDTSTSGFNNGISSNSDILLDTNQRSFKLLKTTAVSSSSPESGLNPSNSSQVGTEESPNGYHTVGRETSTFSLSSIDGADVSPHNEKTVP